MAKSEKLMRVKLRHSKTYPQSCRVMVSYMNVYVNYNPKVKFGCMITLADSDNPHLLWEVVAVEEIIKRTDIKIGWDNNI